MYKSHFEAMLRDGKLPNFMLFFGSDEYQNEFFTKEFISKFDTENLLSLYFEEYDFARAFSHLSQNSLFGGLNFLHIKTDKKIPTKDLKTLVEICKNSSNAVFAYELHDGDMKSVGETSKIFGTNFVRFFPPNRQNEALLLMQNHANKLGVRASNTALYQIYSIHNENLILSISEINKLSQISQEINENLVKNQVFSLSGVSFDTFFNTLLSHKEIKSLLSSLLSDSNFNEISLINSLYSSFFRLFKINAYVKTTGNSEIKSILGYEPPKDVANLLWNQAKSINQDKFLEIFTHLNLLEFEIKNQKDLDKESFLISQILKLQRIINRN